MHIFFLEIASKKCAAAAQINACWRDWWGENLTSTDMIQLILVVQAIRRQERSALLRKHIVLDMKGSREIEGWLGGKISIQTQENGSGQREEQMVVRE